MKTLIALFVVLGSISAHAHGVKRLTTTTCLSQDLTSKVLVKWDSSASIIGPVLVEINGEKVNPNLSIGDDLGLLGSLANGAKYAVMISGEESKAKLSVEGASVELKCDTTTKFRIF